jgi:hypothetical protein
MREHSIILSCFKRLMPISMGIVLCMCLAACGGGSSGGGNGQNNKTSSAVEVKTSFKASSINNSLSSSQQSAATSSFAAMIQLSGFVTYDYVPHNVNYIGLNYLATEVRPGRGLVVELVDEQGDLLESTTSDEQGHYSFNVNKLTLVSVRVKAQLQKTSAPGWNFRVVDNTNNNRPYLMAGALVSSGETDSQRNLHAPSGWLDNSYSEPRVAAPFAILDSIYTGVQRLRAAGYTSSFSALDLAWSTNNKAAYGDISIGEIGTSYFDGTSIYILGDADNDIDEYDPDVILHEWGHYVESLVSRSDSPGGDHTYGDNLDFRLAFSEGFANAFAGMMLNDPFYRDANSLQQSGGFQYDLRRKNHAVRGWFAEASVESTLFNYYLSDVNKVAEQFSDILSIMTASEYITSESLTSIFLFSKTLNEVLPQHAVLFSSLLAEQNISGVDEYGLNESNSGGRQINLPVYKKLTVNGAAVNMCSSSLNGVYNKLANSQFGSLKILTPGIYRVVAVQKGTSLVNSDPDVVIYQRGESIVRSLSAVNNREEFTKYLTAGTYVFELFEAQVHDELTVDDIQACFDLSIESL